MRDSRVAAVATSARSCASCTDEEQRSAKPVPRAAITSQWSPKIESACVASARAATWKTAERQLARDLVHVRQHQQQALRRGEGRRQRAGLERPVDRAGGAALALHLDDVAAPRPRRSAARPADQASASSPIVEAGVIG